ncbi:MAG: hypothetical protein D6706_14465, partial [Chloroflexi bacterium]
FLSGLSGLLHVDGLLATFVTLSLLFLCRSIVNVQSPRPLWHALFFFFLMAGFAILTKSPALLLLPFTGLVLFIYTLRLADKTVAERIRWLIWAGSIWLIALVITLFLLLPAFWVSPQHVVGTITGIAGRHIEQAFRPTFFMGRVGLNHGPLFYPVTMIFRLSPITLSGLILALFLTARHKSWRVMTRWLWWGWAVFFVAGISVASKKFDRYALPVFPGLIILAVLAWYEVGNRLVRWRRFVWGGMILGQLVYLAAFWPYPLLAFNPLAGGPAVAAQVMTVGWGEGIGMAGRWLAAHDESAAEKTAVSGIAPALAPFFPGETLFMEESGIAPADYVIVTLNGRQLDAAAQAQMTANLDLVHTFHFGGLDQAWIYANPEPIERVRPQVDWPEARLFGDRVRLLGADVQAEDGRIYFFAHWQLIQPGGRYIVRLDLLDEAGNRWSGLETELLNEVYHLPQYWADGESPLLSYKIPVPPGMPPGTYVVALSLFNWNDGAQLPILAADGRFLGVTYRSEPVEVPLAARPALVEQLAIPHRTEAEWLNGRLQLLGYSLSREELLAGETVTIDLFWQGTDKLPSELKLLLTLGETAVSYPLSRFDTANWRVGEIVHEKYALPVPPEMATGTYTVQMQINGTDETAVSLGQLSITATDRQFTLPDDIATPLQFQLGTDILLQGLTLKTPQRQPGEVIQFTLYWQTKSQPDTLLSAFAHLLAPDGQVIAQDDHWPGGLPSQTWAAGQVIIDEFRIEIPPDVPPGIYPLAVGLYMPENGQRLAAYDSFGNRLDNDRIILPIEVEIVTANE